MQGSPYLCVLDYFRLQEVDAEFVGVSRKNSKHVIVKLKGKHVYFPAEHVRPVVPDAFVTDVYETDITLLLPADQTFVPPDPFPLQMFLSEKPNVDRVHGVVLFVSRNMPHGRIATLKHGVVFVKQCEVIGGGLLQVGQLCFFNLFFSPSLDRQATFVLLGPEAGRRLQEEYRLAARQVDLKVELELSNPSNAAIFTKHAKDVIASLKRSSKVSVDEHASEIEAMTSRKKKCS